MQVAYNALNAALAGVKLGKAPASGRNVALKVRKHVTQPHGFEARV